MHPDTTRVFTPSPREPEGAGDTHAPGTLLLERYRIVARLGGGAMGSVYRAEDLVLCQEVALKFLSQTFAADPRSDAFLRNEVRLARKVTHPHVCRVHDIGMVNGRPFLSMEYVAGEDLGSLLRRIGRLPHAKALQIAREICGGLHAAHEQEVLHRDLKPANVMLDERGAARLTDFGIAGARAELAMHGGAAGTPQYMAPELFTHHPASVQSDLYALGVTLYELVTGNRPQHSPVAGIGGDQPMPVPPGELVHDLDPAFERAILRCLETDPARRPASALALLAQLPGGDPLADLVAAGRTPTPELVAAAGGSGRLRPAHAVLMVAAVVIGLVLVASLQRLVSLVPRSTLPLPPLVLADRAAQMLGKIGYDVSDGYRAGAFDVYEELLRDVIEQDKGLDRWQILARLRPSVVDYWYRFSPRPLVPGGMRGRVSWGDPPYMQPGMVQVRLDPAGRLRELLAVPEALARVLRVTMPDSVPASGEPDYSPLFTAAGLPLEAFTPVAPIRVPPVFADRRAAWTGVYPEDPKMPVRVEAAAFEGKPIAFRIIEDRYAKASVFTVEQVDVDEVEIRGIVEGYMHVVLVLGALWFAVVALRRRQADLAGARRFAIASFLILAAAVLIGADYQSLGSGVGTVLFQMLATCLVVALQYWVFYVAIESRVRRVWPQMLSAWSRLLAGDVRDPLVGRSVLVGILCGLAATILVFTSRWMPRWFGAPEGAPVYGLATTIASLSGLRQAVACVLSAVGFYSLFGVTWVLLLVVLKSLLRTRWRAVIATVVLYTAIWSIGDAIDSRSVWPQWVLALATAALTSACAVRGGLLALVVGGTTYGLLESFSLVLLPWRWTTELALLTWVVLLGLALFGAWVATGPRRAARA